MAIPVRQHGEDQAASQIKLRSYQHEMLEASLKGNVIVAMDTGSGKTPVAISRIRLELERSSPTALVWFTTPSQALSQQQCEVLRTELPAYSVKLLTGSEGVDAWTNQGIWNAALANVRVVVGTPKVLDDALAHGFVKMSRLVLIVFDECHRSNGNSPMGTIMRNFYHPTKSRGEPVPHILGLSASPTISKKSGTLEEVESTLDCITISPKLHRSDLERHVSIPIFRSVVYSDSIFDSTLGMSPTCQALQDVFSAYDLSTDPFVQYLKVMNDERSLRKLTKILNKPKTYCFDELKSFLNKAKEVNRQAGTTATEWFILTCIERYSNNQDPASLVSPDVTEKERAHLATMLRRVLSLSERSTVAGSEIMLSDKAQKLVTVLLQQPANTRAIVFVEQRAMVSALGYLLRALLPNSSIGTFVGSSTFQGLLSLADLLRSKEQETHLAEFRDGKRNLMISTNVLEEGIDVPACNLIVSFDPPKNLVSFVQRRGRARHQTSQFIVFTAANDIAADPHHWQRLEEKMRQVYMGDRTAVPSTEVAEEDEEYRAYQVTSTGAMITMQEAKAHLYHFCAVSSFHQRRYIDPRPEFEPYKSSSERPWTARVTLPTFVHPSLRTAISSRAYSTEAAAIKDAALEAYINLHKANLLNDHLLPLAANYGPEQDQLLNNQPSLMNVSQPVSAWQRAFHATDGEDTTWYAHRLQITLEDTVALALELYLPGMMLQSLSLNLFWDARHTYQAVIEASGGPSMAKSDPCLQHMRDFTYTILSSVHARYMNESGNAGFAFLLSSGPLRENGHLKGMQGSDSATLLFRNGRTTVGGLINATSQIDRKFHFLALVPPTIPDTDPQLRLKPVSRRKNVLHSIPPIQEGAKSSSKLNAIEFPVSECTVDRLPHQYAMIAAVMPSIAHRVELAMGAQHLQAGPLGSISFDNTQLLVEAMTAPSSSEGFDYNRLEFLGDTILKFYTVRQVLGERLTWPEGYLTGEESRLVSNSTLCRAAQRLGLDQYVRTQAFTGIKWRPPYIAETGEKSSDTREVSSKVMADVVEALIGAAFVEGGYAKAFSCLRVLLPEDEWYSHADPISRLLGEVQNVRCEGLAASLEQLIGYHFRRPALLLEAVTHASFQDNMLGLSYERLEFLGDAVLDMLLVPKMFAHTRKLKEVEMTRILHAVASGHFLGYCCMAYGIEETTQMPTTVANGRPQVVSMQQTSRKVHLYDFLRCGGQVSQHRRSATERFEVGRESIAEALRVSARFPWIELVAMDLPKFLSDVVESVLGALYLDSEGDLDACEAFAQRLGLSDALDRMLNEDFDVLYPKEHLGLAAGRNTVTYLANQVFDGTTSTWRCTARVGDVEVARVDGCRNRDEAEARVAMRAVEALKPARA